MPSFMEYYILVLLIIHLLILPAMISTHQNLFFLIHSSLFMILSFHSLFESCDAICTPSSRGIIPNISSPFHLKGDPKECGNPRFELTCENNVTYISLNSHKFCVKAINYSNYSGIKDCSTIRLDDASINDGDICSFPTNSMSAFNFTFFARPNRLNDLSPNNSLHINFISCPNPLTNSSLYTTDITTHCLVSNSSHHRYAYIKVSELPYTCGVDLIAMTSWHNFKDLNNVSLSEIHESLLYGFELISIPTFGTSKLLLVFRWGKLERVHSVGLI